MTVLSITRPITRVTTPVPAATFVERDRLGAILAMDQRWRLATVHALAASGKTAAVSDWARRLRGVHVAWLACDAADADPATLWNSVCAALMVADPAVAGPLVERVRAADPAPDATGAAALAAFQDLTSPMVLVVDDAHLAGEALATLAPVFELAPPTVRLVVTSRTSLPTRFDRLVRRADTNRLGHAELRCTTDEVIAVLGALGHAVDERIARTILQWSGGWVGAIVLLARDPELGGASGGVITTPPVVDAYVTDEILATLDEPLMRFVEQVSILSHFTADEAAELAGPAAHLLLERAVATHLVTGGLGSAEHRLHPLLARVLRCRLTPERRREIDIRAAARLQAAGHVSAAAIRYFAAGELGRLIELVSSHGPMLAMAHGADTVESWLGLFDLNRAITDDSGQAQALLAWGYHALGSNVHARWWLGQAEAAPALAPPARALGVAVACGLHLTEGDSAQCIAAYEDALAAGLMLPDVAHALAARAAVWHDDTARAARWRAVRGAHDPASTLERLFGDAAKAAQAIVEGDLTGAERVARVALDGADDFGWDAHPAFTDAVRAIGVVHYERNELDLALPWLERAANRADAGRPAGALLAQLGMARWAMATGAVATAADALRRARAAMPPASTSPLLDLATSFEIRLALALSDHTRAAQLLDWLRTPWRRCRAAARIHIHRADPDAARAALIDCWPPETPRARLDGLILTARIEQLAGEHDDARYVVGKALALAAPQGWVRPFIEDGPQLTGLLRDAFESGRYPSAFRAAVKGAGARSRAQPGYAVPTADESATERPRPQRLSARELAVLHLVGGRLTNREIAERLAISPNTLKTHVRAIYHKLGVTTRAEATEVARRLGLQ